MWAQVIFYKRDNDLRDFGMTDFEYIQIGRRFKYGDKILPSSSRDERDVWLKDFCGSELNFTQMGIVE
jgi:hypothetical protein